MTIYKAPCRGGVRGDEHGLVALQVVYRLLLEDVQRERERVRGLGVAVRVEFGRHILKPVFHLIGARVETRRLSAMGGVNVYRPTSGTSLLKAASTSERRSITAHVSVFPAAEAAAADFARFVAVQVAFERQFLNRVFT
jgi:hypothetical protein